MIFLAVMNLTDVVLVKRWNLAAGVPDEVMVLGDCALSPMARRFYIMPLYILAAKGKTTAGLHVVSLNHTVHGSASS